VSLPADARETIRHARDQHVRRTEHVDALGRHTRGAGTRTRSFVDVCYDQAAGDPLLALSFAADLVVKYGDPRGRFVRHRDAR
jgi:hypothetical protein